MPKEFSFLLFGGEEVAFLDLFLNCNSQSKYEGDFSMSFKISGDADFVPVVQKLKELQKEIEIWSFTKPENNCPLSPFLVMEMSKHGDIYQKIKSINSLLHC